MSGVWVNNRDLFCRILRLSSISKADTLVFRANTTEGVVPGIFKLHLVSILTHYFLVKSRNILVLQKFNSSS